MFPAIHSYSFRDRFESDASYTVRQCMEESAAMGFRSMEIMTGKADCPVEHIGSDTVEGIRDVLRYGESLGVDVHCFSTYNDFSYVADEDWRLANIEYIKTWLHLAGEVGVPNIRMLTGYRVEGEDQARLEDLVRRGIEECLPVAEAASVNMAIENHNSLFFTGAEIASLIREFDSPRLTACPDVSNGYDIFGSTVPEGELDTMYDNARRMAPFASNSHLKISGISEDGTLLGWDLPRLLALYRECGYDGPITFESIAEGDLLAPLAQAREILESALKPPPDLIR